MNKLSENKTVGVLGDSSPGNTNRDWAALAIEGTKKDEKDRKEGTVYVGNGGSTLSGVFNWKTVWHKLGTWDSGYNGDVGNYEYFVEIPEWEAVTGLVYGEVVRGPEIKFYGSFAGKPWNIGVGKEYIYNSQSKKWLNENGTEDKDTIRFDPNWTEIPYPSHWNPEFNPNKMTKGIKVKYTPALLALVNEIAAAKNRETLEMNSGFINLYESGDLSVTGNGREVEDLEFLKELKALPEIPKFLTLEFDDFEASITPEKVVVGCQTFTHEEAQKMKEAVETFWKGITVELGTRRIHINPDGIVFNGTDVSWPDYDKIIVGLEGFKK